MKHKIINKTQLSKNNPTPPSTTHQKAFTIVELLVVIVVIGILAAITIVSYTGISQKAITASLQSDLTNASKKLKLYQVEHGQYPDSLDANSCPVPADTNYCIKPSSSNSFAYSSNNTSNPQTFVLDVSKNTDKYRITNNTPPTTYTSLALTDPANWLTIGTQTWAKANRDFGARINGTVAQTNNGGTNVVEKYCYDDLDSNCATYGGLYQWGEAMGYITTENAQGICPVGSHIPSDNDWKILEKQLGMSQTQADSVGWRGTDQGAQLKQGGISGLNVLLAGYRSSDTHFYTLLSHAHLWSSSEYNTRAWGRYQDSGFAASNRGSGLKSEGYSVRCLGN